MQVATQTLEKHIQVISSDLMEALKESAEARGITFEMEIALRLTAHMAEPSLASDNSVFSQIMNKSFTLDEATAECQRKREAHHYLFEIEKLRNYLRFEPGLPRHVKETFTLIDVKTETPRLRAEIELENKRNYE